MFRKSILGLAILSILVCATAAALVAHAFSPGDGYHYSNREWINRPYYFKGKLLEDCPENPECALMAW